MNVNLPESSLLPPAVVMYIASKCYLPAEIIQNKLLNGQIFDIKGEGTDLDTHIMEEVLNQNDFYQKQYQKLMKDDAMKFVKSIVEQWSVEIAKNQMKISKDQIINYEAKALPFGSYVLDLKSNNSDIDLVCVCPSYINRQTHFFGGLVKKLGNSSEVVNLSSIINAKVPIITFDFKQINIDLSFCQLNTQTLPRDIQKVISTELANSITDKKSRTSLFGRKNNLMILQLAGKEKQYFKETLRVIKVWAKNRGLSSNGMGYLGGISLAILLAKVCQIFPNHKPNRLLVQFFQIYNLWNWKTMPVQLIPYNDPQKQDKRQALISVWTPGDSINSTERVNEITLKVLTDQIRRASIILTTKKDIRELCRKPDFLNSFPAFIEIDICGRFMGENQKENQKEYKTFQSTIESKILNLLQNMIKYNKKQLDEGSLRIVPNPHIYKKKDPNYNYCNCILFGVDVQSKVQIGRGIRQWMILIAKLKGEQQNLNVRLFKVRKEELDDLIITEVKKKEEKKDPRLDNRANKKPSDGIKTYLKW